MKSVAPDFRLAVDEFSIMVVGQGELINSRVHGSEDALAEYTCARLVEWNKGPLGQKAGHPLQDPRVVMHEGDVARILVKQQKAFDAILLDVDNGPEGLTRRENDWLYGVNGLNAAYTALRSKGVLAAWSAGPDQDFVQRLRKVGFEVEQVRVHAHGSKGARHVIWFAIRDD